MTIPSLEKSLAWISAFSLAFGVLWYINDARREMREIEARIQDLQETSMMEMNAVLDGIQAVSEQEAARDKQWMLEDDHSFDDVSNKMREHNLLMDARLIKIEEDLVRLGNAISTANDDLNYRLGMHVGDHEYLERLLERNDAKRK